VATVAAVELAGARPVFADIRPDTLNIDEARIEALVTPRTRAVVVVHYAGVGCEMDAILQIAARHGLPVIEDNAHGLFGAYRGRSLGTFGCLATQSFHETKNVTCGEGGALVVNDAGFVERAEIIREKGTNRSRFFRGQVDKYTWVDVGSSYLPSEALAAFLFAQLECRGEVQDRRRRIWHAYHDRLRGWAADAGARLPVVPEHCEQAYHMFYLLLPSLAKRNLLMGHLKSRGIASTFHYLPLHLSPMGSQWGGKAGDCPVTEDISDRLLRLPFYNSLSDQDIDRVVSALLAFDLRAA
jgi:dTDP-4-amino-4,6-dideoxygalactose transaminase